MDWSDENQRAREGLDVRGANPGQGNLSGLPLTRLHGGLTYEEWSNATSDQRAMAALLMGGANLERAQLQGANLRAAEWSNRADPACCTQRGGAHRGRARILALFMQKRKVSEHAVREVISEPI